MKRFWPGLAHHRPSDRTARTASARASSASGYPSHPLAQGLVEAAGVPLLVPSANISGDAAGDDRRRSAARSSPTSSTS